MLTNLPPESVLVADSSLTLQRFVYSLYHSRRLLLGIAMTVFSFSILLAFTTAARYTATASFLPPSSNGTGSALLDQASALGVGLLGNTKTSGDQSVGILKSSTIAARMVNRFNLLQVYGVKKGSQAAAVLANNSDFIVGPKDGIVVIQVTDHSPERARDMANAYLHELETTTDQLALTESSQRRLFYEEKLAHEKDALAAAEVALRTNQEQSGLVSPAGQTSNELQAIAQLRSQIAAHQMQLAGLLHDETEQNPNVIRVRKEMDSLQGQVQQMEHGKQDPGGNISRAQVPALQLDYIRLQREVKYHETLFDILSKQYEAARLDESHDSPLQVLDKATIPDSKSGPHRLLIMLFGFVLGILVGVAAVILQLSLKNFNWNPNASAGSPDIGAQA